tara:strand:- start:200 stop:2017 length:1818 start_codon:yes stop_codon:yes gene_type:complete
MKTRLYFIFCFFVFSFTIGQTNQNEHLAREYYRLGEFEKAKAIFEDIYSKKKVQSIYEKYLDCLIKTQDFKTAEKTIKNFYKKKKNPTILVDLGKLHAFQGDIKLANETFEKSIKEAKKDKRFLSIVGSKLYKEKKYAFALKAYLLAKQENSKAQYHIQISNIYSHLGEIESMYKELIDLVIQYPHYFQTCKNIIRRTISDDNLNDNNKKLKNLLIKNIQKNNSQKISKLLVWLFIQEKKFDKALEYEISIHKKLTDNLIDIIELSDISLSNNDFSTTKKALEYVLKNSNPYSFNYEYSSWKLLDIEFEELKGKKIKKDQDINVLIKKHEDFLQLFGIKPETITALHNYCYLLSVEANQQDKAIQILNNAIINPNLTNYDIATCKMELAKILISNDNIWESILLYSQVENDFAEDIIGQQAKFEKTKINYYNGDFEWAQNQLKVLKHSTSKLIANNAMKLSLLISDNLNLDTTNTALLLYAKSELLFEQKKYKLCLDKLHEIEKDYPGHMLTDEVLFKKFNLFVKTNEYTKALESLKKICSTYYYDILYDDALFYQAELYETVFKDHLKAQEKYEEVLLKTPNSIFVNKARAKYRSLRKDNFLKL